ncbi:MAG: hypothetical protein ACK4N5_23875, partial [Myxococcales bacterium]
MRPLLLPLAAVLLPATVAANTLPVRMKSRDVTPHVGKSLHVVDVRADGIDYLTSVRVVETVRSSASTGQMEFGVVVVLPSRPAEVAVIPSAIFTGLDRATTGQVLPCPSALEGCGGGENFGGSDFDRGAPAQTVSEFGNVPLRASLLAATAEEAAAFLDARGMQVTDALKGQLAMVYADGLVAFVAWLADDPTSVGFGFGGVSRAVSLRFSFPGATPPFRLPLHLQPAANDQRTELSTSVVVIGSGRGTLNGVEVVPVDVAVVPSFTSRSGSGATEPAIGGDPAFTPRAFDQVVR